MENNKKFRISYASAIYGKEEINAVNKVLKNPLKIVAGPLVRKFEKKIAKLFGKKYGVMTNSGSSANLIALDVLNLPAGSEIITPLLTFGTTLSPIIQKNLIPVFIDVSHGTYVINEKQIEKLVTKKTKALMIPSLLGNIPNLEKIKTITKKHKLYFIEDSCDTLGPKFKNRPTGYYSDISTTSFYASHIITAAGNGGMACFHNPLLAKKALIMTNWGRESTLFGFYEKSEELKKRFSGILDGDAYDAKFIFSELGYNFQPTEINGAFGLEQLKRFKKFKSIRQRNFSELMKFFKKLEKFFILPKQYTGINTTWLAFPLTIKKEAGFTRLEITKYLEKHNVQTRPIFTGNALKQPAFRNIKCKIAAGGYPVTDYIMKNGFVIGCHHGLNKKHINRLKQIFLYFLKNYK